MKKFTAFLLIFSLMMLSANLYAKERRGAKLIITKTDGGQIKGELIVVKVKQKSLLLLDTEGKDESVDIKDIKVITIVRKSKALGGVGLGLLTVLVIGALVGLVYEDPTSVPTQAAVGALIGAAYFGIPAVIIGGIAGAAAGKDKTILVEGRHPSSIEFILKELRKKARIRDYK